MASFGSQMAVALPRLGIEDLLYHGMGEFISRNEDDKLTAKRNVLP